MKKQILIFLFCSNLIYSQTVKLDTNSILIGQQINLTISNPLKNTTLWPNYIDTIVTGIEIITSNKVDTINDIIKQIITITSWDSGSYYIPPIIFSKNILTKGLQLNVSSVNLEKDAQYKDIKQPLHAKISWNDIWPWLIAILILVIIIYILRKYVFIEKEQSKKIKQKAIIPPSITALNELEKLEKKKLCNQGRIKEYYSEISEIIRRYTEKRFRFIALELTTNEILEIIKNKVSNEELCNLEILLQRADLAKFAKSKPIDTENNESMQLATNFVISTQQEKNNE